MSYSMDHDLYKLAERFCRPLHLPFDPEQALNELPIAELHRMRRALNIKGISALPKARLAAYIARTLPEATERCFEWFDEILYQVMSDADPRTGELKDIFFPPEYLEYLYDRGMLFAGFTRDDETVMVVPPDVLARFRRIDGPEYRDRVKKNTEWSRIIAGLLRYHGVLMFDELYELISTYICEEPDERYLLHFALHASEYNTLITVIPDAFVNIFADDPDHVLAERKARQDLGNYPFTKAELLEAGKVNIVDNDEAFCNMVIHLKRMGMEDYDAVMLTATMRMSWQNDISPNDMIGETFELLGRAASSRDEIDKLMAQIQELVNNTRLWILRGHTPNEAAAKRASASLPNLPARPKLTLIAGGKTGSNDPCPCGSGKKYKKCCMEREDI